MKNLIWLNIDSLRYDYTSLGNSSWDTTPFLESLSDRGISFNSCYSSGIKTPTSTASMLTATYPMYTGIYGNEQKNIPVLDDNITTVAEHLSSVGFNTSGVSRNIWVSEKSGLDRGFDRFQWFEQSPRKILPELSASEVVEYVREFYSLTTKFGTNGSLYSTGPVVSNRLKRELKRLNNKSDPFFLFGHYNEPHRPYLPPKKYCQEYLPHDTSISDAIKHSWWMHSELYDIIARGDQEELDRDILTALYAAEVSHTDDMIRRLEKYINFDDTIVVVTADHGEFFGEYGMYGHQLMPLEATTRVPLISVGLPSEISNRAPVQHIDIMDTALQSLGEPFGQSQGYHLIDQERDSVLTEWFSSIELFESNNPDFNSNGKFLRGHSQCVQKDRYRYMTDGDKTLTFADDGKSDLSEDMIESMSATLEEYQSIFGREHEVAFHTSNSAKARLRDLGYIN